MVDDSITINSSLSKYKPVDFKGLPWEEQAEIMWGWFWRVFIISVLTIWLSSFFGGLIGNYIKLAVGDLDPLVLTSIGFMIGASIGYLGINPTIKWLTSDKMGNYRVVILKKQPTQLQVGAG